MPPFSLLAIALPILLQRAHAAPLEKRLSAVPAVPQNFPDPSVISVNDNWYAFATNNGQYNVQIAQSADFNTWNYLNQDALPQLPSWVDASAPNIWAPDVSQRDDGTFFMYFSASLAQFPAHHCTGYATSNTITGPYTALDKPLVCPDPNADGTSIATVIASPGQGGAIDASGFRDSNGDRYLLYKVDGNSLVAGGTCGNEPATGSGMPTPIMLVPVEENGMDPTGSPVQLLDRDPSVDGPLIEAPSLGITAPGQYTLFFSSNCFDSDNYDVTWAYASSPTGPYTRSGPLLTSGVVGLDAPGGATVAKDGSHMVFHANSPAGRSMFTTSVSGSGAAVKYS